MEDKSTLVCCETALCRGLRGGCAEVLGVSCSLAVEDCSLARGSESIAVPLVCRNDCSGLPLPTASRHGSGFSLCKRSLWLSGLVVRGRERNNGDG